VTRIRLSRRGQAPLRQGDFCPIRFRPRPDPQSDAPRQIVRPLQRHLVLVRIQGLGPGRSSGARSRRRPRATIQTWRSKPPASQRLIACRGLTAQALLDVLGQMAKECSGLARPLEARLTAKPARLLRGGKPGFRPPAALRGRDAMRRPRVLRGAERRHALSMRAPRSGGRLKGEVSGPVPPRVAEQSFNVKTCRRLAALIALYHAAIRRLDMARDSRAIKKRRRQTIGCEALPVRGEQRRLLRQPQRQVFIVSRVDRHEFGHADRIKEARGDTGGKGAAGKREERKSGPKGVARGCMSVVRRRV
jgi:hypothetical protein